MQQYCRLEDVCLQLFLSRSLFSCAYILFTNVVGYDVHCTASVCLSVCRLNWSQPFVVGWLCCRWSLTVLIWPWVRLISRLSVHLTVVSSVHSCVVYVRCVDSSQTTIVCLFVRLSVCLLVSVSLCVISSFCVTRCHTRLPDKRYSNI